MKKYKHKVTGDIATMKHNNSSFYVYDGLDIHARIVENSNDWEEIIQKNYEILSYKAELVNEVSKASQFSDTQFGGNSYWKINSIRRLSDNEVFSIGDELVDTFNRNHGKFTLKEIEFENAPVDKDTGKLSFVHTHPILGKWILLERLEKAKPVLFVTEDGKDVFEDDNFWTLYLPGYTGTFPDWSIRERNQQLHLQIDLKNDFVKRFSSFEKAQDYIILNKPVLSINDVLQQIRMASKTLDEDGLRALVKSRL